MEYSDFILELRSAGDQKFCVSIKSSPDGGDSEKPLSTLELPWNWSRESSRCVLRDIGLQKKPTRGRLTSEEIGTRLYDAILPDSIRAIFERNLETAQGLGMGLRLKIFLNPRDQAVRFLQGLPWELMFRKEGDEFLALSRSTPIVRTLAVPRAARTNSPSKKLRILAAKALPPGAPELDLPREIAEMQSANERGSIEIVPWIARVAELRDMLDYQGPFDVLHFLGHGDFSPGTQEGALLFERNGGEQEWVEGLRLAEKLRDFNLRLVVLNACKSAQTSHSPTGNPFGGVAASLVQAGFPAVLAMQEVVEDQSAIALSRTLYHKLASKQPIEVAVTEARQAVFDLNPAGLDWAIPCLFLRTSPVHAKPSHSSQEELSSEHLVKAGISAFRSDNYTLAREMLAKVADSEEARLFETLARFILGTPLSIKTALEIDKSLQQLAGAPDTRTANLARLALGILRHDVIEPRYIKTDGMSSTQVFNELKNRDRPDAFEREIARALSPSRGAMIRFRIYN